MTVGIAQAVPTEYVLKTADEKTEATLAIDFISLMTNEYSSWEAFGADLDLVLSSFQKAYEVPLATRMGLRYINDLSYSNTGTEGVQDLVDMLNPELSNVLEKGAWDIPVGAVMQLLLPSNGERLGLRMGYDSKPEPHVVLDFDYFAEFSPPQEWVSDALVEAFRRYHKVLYNAFRWSIRDDKIAVFGPSA